MIELITGTPGSGKTTYAVAERIVPESRRKVPLEDETCDKLGLERGTVIQRRVVCAGVRGLKIEHERLPHVLTRDEVRSSVIDEWNKLEDEKDDRPKHLRLPGDPPVECEAIVQNWWLWCKPGDFIVVDEVHLAAPRATMGKKAPFWITALSMHRHYGVDFLFISQDPGMIDITMRKVAGLHRHVRSVMGSPLCMVYTWDHASNPERTSTATKAVWRRKRSMYRLFHSSIAHVKPPAAGRGGLIFAGVLAVAVAGGGYAWAQKRFGKDDGGKPAAGAAGGPAAVRGGGQEAPAAPGSLVVVHQRVAGCYAVGDGPCRCMDEVGRPALLPQELCRKSAAGFEGAIRRSSSGGRSGRLRAPRRLCAAPC